MSRQALLDATVAHLQQHGLADQSLRRIAEAVGTSHRMLVYHFGSAEGLLAAVVAEVERRQRDATVEAIAGVDPHEAIERLWTSLTDPRRGGEERLFFELAGQALQGRPGTEALRQQLVEPWLEVGAALAGRLGLDEDEARAVTRVDVAVVRGLLLDLLATGDRQGVDAAFARYRAWRAAGTAPGAAAPGRSRPARRARSSATLS